MAMGEAMCIVAAILAEFRCEGVRNCKQKMEERCHPRHFAQEVEGWEEERMRKEGYDPADVSWSALAAAGGNAPGPCCVLAR